MTDQIKAAWQKAEDAWQRAGATTPCYEADYMVARKDLANAMFRAGLITKKEAARE